MKLHDSMRGYFFYYLHQTMENDKDIYLICIDLGYKAVDELIKDFPDRVIVTPASEQSAVGLSVGLAMEGKKVFVYTITPFFYRAFETIRNYIDHEKIPVCLVGSGMNKDYESDGFSHEASDIYQVMDFFKNITKYYPSEKESIKSMLDMILEKNEPSFIGLRR